MRARFATTGSPPMSLPRARGRAWALSPKPLAERISRRRTFSRSSFGSSMPITERPGMVEQRQARRGHRAGDVVGEADDARRLEAGGGLELVHGDDRAGADRDDLAADAVVVEHVLEHARVLLERVVREVVADDGRRALQQREGRGAPGVGGLGVEGELGLLVGAGAGAFRTVRGRGAWTRGSGGALGRALEDGDLGLGGGERRASRKARGRASSSGSPRARTAATILAMTPSVGERSAAGSIDRTGDDGGGASAARDWRAVRASAASFWAARAPPAAPATARPVRPWAPA